ncbi:MAG TPA: dTDP-4-dehydrorhamnose 3,5-epimerase family protein [Bryobacteraceae bacterium]|nr:dTDP-4-dehydrorhamnose 3,5-epimerase family protein [Bryobacteraceae bacterium]
MSAVQSAPVAIDMPRCEHGIGKLITSPSSPDLIEGVRIEPVALWPDDRGWFLELSRLGSGLSSHFPLHTTQASAAVSFPGTIKAFHFHKHQHDLWTVVKGMLQVALVDLRPDSPGFGRRNTLYIGTLRPWQVLVPPGVGHGYKVIGDEPAVLVYLTDRHYNPADEGRIPYDHPGIHYDWETQHK